MLADGIGIRAKRELKLYLVRDDVVFRAAMDRPDGHNGDRNRHRQRAVPFELRRISRDEVFGADELLLSSATKEVLAITTLDGQPVGNPSHRGLPGPVCAKLYAAYQDAKVATAG